MTHVPLEHGVVPNLPLWRLRILELLLQIHELRPSRRKQPPQVDHTQIRETAHRQIRLRQLVPTPQEDKKDIMR